jgi:hypothetical protein
MVAVDFGRLAALFDCSGWAFVLRPVAHIRSRERVLACRLRWISRIRNQGNLATYLSDIIYFTC